MVPEAHDPSERREPRMLTTDLALRFDPVYEQISRRFHGQPRRVRRRVRPGLVQADPPRHGPGRALPRRRGAVRGADLAGPAAGGDHELIDDADVAALKAKVLDSGLTVSQLVSTAWASASSFRGSDKRGGVNGARIRLEPQSGWEVNNPDQLAIVLRDAGGHPAGVQRADGASRCRWPT